MVAKPGNGLKLEASSSDFGSSPKGGPPRPSPPEGSAGAAGRGGLAVAFAKVYFLLTGLLQQILLTRVLGTAGYGALSTVLSFASIAYNPVVTTSIQGVSRAVAGARDDERQATIRKTLAIHAALAIPVAVGFFVFAGFAMRTANAPHLVVPLRILSLVLLFYGLYAPLVGVLNGQRRFVWQAALDVLYATLRTIIMVGGAYLFARIYHRGVEGATVGFSTVSAIIVLFALVVAGTGKKGPAQVTLGGHLSYVAPLMLGQVLLNLLQQADLTLLRYFAGAAAARQGMPLQGADPLVGAYRATQLFCFLPYQLLLSITFVLFPLLARAHRDGNQEQVATFVRTGVRLAVVIAGAIVAVTSGLSGPLLRMVFPGDVEVLATRSMHLLTLGFGAFALFGIFTTVLTSLKRERASAAITGLAFALVIALGSVWMADQPLGSDLLYRTAVATTVGLVLATLVAAWAVRRTAKAVLAPTTLLRTCVALAVAVTVGRYWSPQGMFVTVLAAILVGGVYVAVLVASRELRVSDLQQLRAVIPRRSSRPS